MFSYATVGDLGLGRADEEENLDVFGNGGDTYDDLQMGQLTAREAVRIDGGRGAVQGVGQYVQPNTKPLPFSDAGRLKAMDGIHSNMLTHEDIMRAVGGMKVAQRRVGMSGNSTLDWGRIFTKGLKAQGLGLLEKVPKWAKIAGVAGVVVLGMYVAASLAKR
jgi:hypothetical protein